MFFPCCSSSVFGFLFPLCPFSLLLFSLFLSRFFCSSFFLLSLSFPLCFSLFSFSVFFFALLPFSFPFFCSSFFLPFRLFLFGFSLFFFFPLSPSPSPSPSFLFFLVSLVVFYALLFANKKLRCSCRKDSLSTIRYESKGVFNERAYDGTYGMEPRNTMLFSPRNIAARHFTAADVWKQELHLEIMPTERNRYC